MGNFTIFPNFSGLDRLDIFTFRVWHPMGPTRTLVYHWTVVPKNLPDDIKEGLRQRTNLAFGPAGTFEQDDAENWVLCIEGMNTGMAW